MNVNERLQHARCLLLLHAPWYGHAAMMMTWLSSVVTETMGVRVVNGGEVECVYNPAFVTDLSVLELAAVVQHEVEHVVRCHCTRRSTQDPWAWNIAADMAVNGTENHPHIGLGEDHRDKVIPHRDSLSLIPYDWNPHETTEFYHRQLSNDLAGIEGRMLLDDHGLWEQSDISGAEMADVAQVIVVEAAVRSRGQVPDHVRRELLRLAQPLVPWNVLLRRYLCVCLTQRRTTYLRRNRRQDIFGIPGYVRRGSPHVSVVVDVSGSISENALALFFGELEAICSSARVDVLRWDHKHQGFTRNYRRGDWKRISLTGGGGTDMAAPVEWLAQRGLTGDCVVILTDGFCNWPPPGSLPLIAVISEPEPEGPTWGKTVRLGV